ncbi:5'-3' exoribonuclease 2, partial [Coemansia sp. RSA 532]
MGVAAFYRWLTRKYPKVQTRVVEEKPSTFNDIEIPVDATKPNPNGVEFDNLYLDMNGIVHPCCHPQHKEAPETEEEMMVEVFKCLDRVFNMIRPRKLVYMALDGVAPRAKMNQQRSRRFRAAQEAEEKEKERELYAEEVFRATGVVQPEPKASWDSNCITPGTPFMELLAKSLRYYVALKFNTDPAWKNVKVVLSDSNVPGEGEHKIMDYIRRQRMMPAHDPNTTHVLYGLDADLIMLSLATHEPHFRILREDVAWADALSKPCRTCGKLGHFTNKCLGPGQDTPGPDPNDQPFVFAHIDILREYLEVELKPTKPLPFPFDLERAIDDWVFLCFFVGNDFLPHLPSLEIREGAIEKLVGFWKDELVNSTGYITHNGDVDLFRIQPIMDKVGELEEETFKERKRGEEQRERRMQQNQMRDMGDKRIEAAADEMAAVAGARARREREVEEKQQATNKKNFAAANLIKARLAAKANVSADKDTEKDAEKELSEEDEVMVSGSNEVPVSATKRTAAERDDEETGDGEAMPHDKMAKINISDAEMNEPQAKQAKIDISESETVEAAIEDTDGENSEAKSTDGADANDTESGIDTTETQADTSKPEEVVDPVKFHEAGYKARYYGLKFNIAEGDKEKISEIVEHYVRGLCWVLKYYYQGCMSWSWYYPYHYAPLASDFCDLDMVNATLDLGAPLRPYEQLMGVLPARSRIHLPAEFGPLMTSPDSPIIDFYPVDFPLDLNGKKFLWQAVILLPFIDQTRLLDAVQKVYPQLSREETARNERGHELLLVSSANSLYESLCDVYTTPDATKLVPLNPRFSNRMSGTVSSDANYVPHTKCETPLHNVNMRDIEDDRSITVVFHQPEPGTSHNAVLLPGVQLPRRALTMGDIEFVRSGGNSGYRGRPRNPRGENTHDHGHFYRQQGNDVSGDRGRGPRRYDEQGNTNPAYQQQYSGRGRGRGRGRGNHHDSYRSNDSYRPHDSHRNDSHRSHDSHRNDSYRPSDSYRPHDSYVPQGGPPMNRPPPPRPSGYTP